MTLSLEPKIVDKATFRVAGVSYQGNNEHGEIPALWDNQFLPRMRELDPIRTGGTYGIARAIAGVDASQGFEYLAGDEVQQDASLPPYMVAWQIPANTYAVLPAQGVAGIGPVDAYFNQEWLPQSTEWEAAGGFMMEFYPPSFGQDMVLYLYYPVVKKK